MVKNNSHTALKWISFVVILLFVEVTAIMIFTPNNSLIGFSVVNLSEAYSKLYPGSKIFLIVQWAVIALIVLGVYLKNMTSRKKTDELSDVDLNAAMKGAKTKLDVFYTILKTKKRVSIRAVSELFKINQDLAMEWARILETGNLALIEYPGFGSPIVNLVEKHEKLIDSPINKIN
jgi:predicted MPP superfamily phosphohydrolase